MVGWLVGWLVGQLAGYVHPAHIPCPRSVEFARHWFQTVLLAALGMFWFYVFVCACLNGMLRGVNCTSFTASLAYSVVVFFFFFFFGGGVHRSSSTCLGFGGGGASTFLCFLVFCGHHVRGYFSQKQAAWVLVYIGKVARQLSHHFGLTLMPIIGWLVSENENANLVSLSNSWLVVYSHHYHYIC